MRLRRKVSRTFEAISSTFTPKVRDGVVDVPIDKTVETDSSSSELEDTYVLKRDYNASTRLTAQHLLWKEALGCLIHPSIPVPSRPRIADVATGNGHWLMDVASSLEQSYDLDGFDISLDQVPTSGLITNCTRSIRFYTWDIREEPPLQFVEAFDILHIRLITVVFRDNNPVPIIESLKKLLKPGGFLQWEEVDNTSCTVLKPGSTKAPALEEALAQLAGSGKGDWKQNGAQVLNGNGFSNAQQLHIEPNAWQARYWTDMYMSTWAEYVSKVMGNPEKANTLGEQAMKEVRAGASISVPMWVWIAQKSY